ncbi:LuxR C-terminal-related transcriptional regulator [Actinokineospora sp. HUAS TT18]|uniref:helix-turn-helix transcriptional regulator n=1 Tax=Actinokineospora sp. HUAS TT18 TaxID=3447451 RepID=UPI003F5284CE
MVEDDLKRNMIENLLARRLPLLRQLTGLPVVFGGAVRQVGAGRLVINQLFGTLSQSLNGLVVPSGRGLGGTAIERGSPFLVNDYASNKAITHDYDRIVVDHERLTSIFAFPIKLNGQVGAIIYGAVRDDAPIGQVALRHAGVVARKLEKELDGLIGRPTPPQPPSVNSALTDLAAIIRTTDDPTLRDKLARIHQQLGGAPLAPAADAVLAAREVDALRLVAVGASNAEIAQRLGLSPETVKAYLRSAMRKLEVHNRTAAVHAARTAGIL